MHIIAGEFRSRRLISPKGELTKPTTGKLREAVFNICQNEIEGASFLDLYAGSGAMGLEALSRGAQKATFVDNSREAISALKKNCETLLVTSRVSIIAVDIQKALITLEKQGKQFDIIYADPPYSQTDVESLIKRIDESSLLKAGGQFFIEEAKSAAPERQELKNLRLHKSRDFGKSLLLEFVRD